MICSLMRKMSRNSLKFVTLWVFAGLTAIISARSAVDESSLRASGHMYDIYKKPLANFPKYDYELDKVEGRKKHTAQKAIKLDKWNNVLDELQQNQKAYLNELREDVGDGKRSIVTESLHDKFKERLNGVNDLMDEGVTSKCNAQANGGANIDSMQRPERGSFSFYKKKPLSDGPKGKDDADLSPQSSVENDKTELSKTDGDNSLSACKANASKKFASTENYEDEKKRLRTKDKDLTGSRHEMKRNAASTLYGINKMLPWEEIGARGYDYERSLMNMDLQEPKNYFFWQKNDGDDPTNDYSIERFINQCNLERYPGRPLKAMKRHVNNLNAINNVDHCEIKRILETPPTSYKHYVPNNGQRVLKQYAEQMNATILQATKHVVSLNSSKLDNQLKLMHQQQDKKLKSNYTKHLNNSLEQQCKRTTKPATSIMLSGIPSAASVPTNQCSGSSPKLASTIKLQIPNFFSFVIYNLLFIY